MTSPGRWRARLGRGLLCAIVVALLVGALPAAGMAQDPPELFIDTVAGTGDAGYNGDGIPATTAQLNAPEGVAVDADDVLYIADALNNRIRRVAPDTGLIDTVAGTGTAGYNGDGIDATTAQVNSPQSVAVAPADNALYIADTVNARVRRVDPGTGLIETVAGTGAFGYNGDGIPATTAELNSPQSVAVGSDGAVYIADVGNARVRRVDPGTGLIDTVAGTGTSGYNGDGIDATTAQVNAPGGVAVDADGAVYIGDTGNHRVRRVDPDTGLIDTVAGTGDAGYNGDGIPATNAELFGPRGVVKVDGDLYIADSGNERVRHVDGDTGLITTVAGTGTAGYNGDGIPATGARLRNPQDVAVDPANGALLIADGSNHRVRVVGPGSHGLQRRIFYQCGNHTFDLSNYPGLARVNVIVVGGGGSGGGAQATGGNERSAGSGGGGGGMGTRLIDAGALGAGPIPVTVGCGGEGATPDADGNPGQASSFGGFVSATGGGGGAAGVAVDTSGGQHSFLGGNGGVGQNGELNVNGSGGGTSRVINAQVTQVGHGGASGGGYGGGARGPHVGGGGIVGRLYGAGSPGAANTINSPARASKPGARGIVIVEIYR